MTDHADRKKSSFLGSASPLVSNPARDRSTIVLGLIFGLLSFLQGLVEPTEGLLSQPAKSLLRDWGHSMIYTAQFAAILSIPWVIKPLYGLFTDFIPLAGSRRRNYLLLSTAIASVGVATLYWVTLEAHMATLMLILLLFPAVGTAFADVVIDALIVDVGRTGGKTGEFQSIQWASMYAATIFTGFAGGVLSHRKMQQGGFLIAGIGCAVSFTITWFFVRDPPRSIAVSPPSLRKARSGWNAYLTDSLKELRMSLFRPGILAMAIFFFLWDFNPFATTVLYFYSTRSLHFNDQLVGSLTSWHAGGEVLGSVLYGVVASKIPVKWLIHCAILTGVLSVMVYWGYRDSTSAVIVSVVAGIFQAIGTVIQLDLATRVTHSLTAGTTFAMFMSLANLGILASESLGGSLFEVVEIRWNPAHAFGSLILVGVLCTVSCWFLAPTLNQAVHPSICEGK